MGLEVQGDLVTSNSLMFRNRIINGDMRIDQRNAGTTNAQTSANTSAFTVDRFSNKFFGTTYPGGTLTTAIQSTDAPDGFTNSLRITAAQSITFDSNRLGAFLTHEIEGNNVYDLAWGTAAAKAITLSFWIKANKTGSVSVNLENSAADRSYGAVVTISAAGVWEYKTVVIPGDTSGTWLKNNQKGITVNLGLGNNGSWLTGAAGTWSATRAVFNSAQTNFLSTTNDYLALTGVQLEAGSSASAFERRPYGMELALCQRYCWVISGQGECVANGTNWTSTQVYCILPYPVPMRAQPGLEKSSNDACTLFHNNSTTSSTVIGVDVKSNRAAELQIYHASSFLAGGSSFVRLQGAGTHYLRFTAEL